MSEILTFGIENFKVFEKHQEFKIKPITILTGKNNSGKSSLIQALKFLSKTFQKNIFSEVELTDAEHNLGDFNNAKNFNNKSNFISFDIDGSRLVYSVNKNLTNVAFLEEIIIIDEGKNPIVRVQPILGDLEYSEFYIITAESDYKNLINRYILDNRSDKKLTTKKIRILTAFISDLYKNKENVLGITIGGGMPIRDYQSEFFWGINNFIESDFQNNKTNYKIKGDAKKDLTRNLKQKLTLIKAKYTKYNKLTNQEEEFLINYTIEIFVYMLSKIKIYFERILIDTVKDIFYIGAFRGYPDRLYKSKQSSGFVGEAIFNHFRITKATKNGMGSNFHIEEFVKKWLKEFEIGEDYEFISHPILGYQLLIHRNNNKISLNDLGFGSMQLFSIILFISNIEYKKFHDNFMSGIICIEEPESHLHPKLQSLLADFLIDSLQVHKYNLRSLILESHSEYMIRKFQYLVAKGEIKAEDIVIYYFNDQDEVAKGAELVKELHIREDGMMDGDFGHGFFDESTRQTINLLKLQNKN